MKKFGGAGLCARQEGAQCASYILAPLRLCVRFIFSKQRSWLKTAFKPPSGRKIILLAISSRPRGLQDHLCRVLFEKSREAL